MIQGFFNASKAYPEKQKTIPGDRLFKYVVLCRIKLQLQELCPCSS